MKFTHQADSDLEIPLTKATVTASCPLGNKYKKTHVLKKLENKSIINHLSVVGKFLILF